MPKFKITADHDGYSKADSTSSWGAVIQLATANLSPVNDGSNNAALSLNTQIVSGPKWKCFRPWFRFNLATFPDIGSYVDIQSVTVTLNCNLADFSNFTNSGVLKLFKSTAVGTNISTADYDAFDRAVASDEVALVDSGLVTFKMYKGSKLLEHVEDVARNKGVAAFMIRNRLDYAGAHEPVRDGGGGNQGRFLGTSNGTDLTRFDGVNYSGGNGGPVIEIDYHIPKYSSVPGKHFTINTFRVEELERGKSGTDRDRAVRAPFSTGIKGPSTLRGRQTAPKVTKGLTKLV
jgi:hypothetical protein